MSLRKSYVKRWCQICSTSIYTMKWESISNLSIMPNLWFLFPFRTSFDNLLIQCCGCLSFFLGILQRIILKSRICKVVLEWEGRIEFLCSWLLSFLLYNSNCLQKSCINHQSKTGNSSYNICLIFSMLPINSSYFNKNVSEITQIFYEPILKLFFHLSVEANGRFAEYR